jgi:hypothetical protein
VSEQFDNALRVIDDLRRMPRSLSWQDRRELRDYIRILKCDIQGHSDELAKLRARVAELEAERLGYRQRLGYVEPPPPLPRGGGSGRP